MPRVRRTMPARRRVAILQIQAQALAFALGMAAAALGQPAKSAHSGAVSVRAAAPSVRTGVAIYRGQGLRYEVVDGLAIHGGRHDPGHGRRGGRRVPEMAFDKNTDR